MDTRPVRIKLKIAAVSESSYSRPNQIFNQYSHVLLLPSHTSTTLTSYKSQVLLSLVYVKPI